MRNQSILMHTLHTALSMKRPHYGDGATEFTLLLWDLLPEHLRGIVTVDDCANLHVDNRHGTSRTLFVAHVDTVHHKDGKNKIRKTKTHWYAKGDVLGADDGAGVALLMHMIHHDVPGYYIFTQGEERGGIGATYLAKEKKDLLAQFDRAIAFDRRGLDSVITHQGWGRCCSDEFGSALCYELGKANDNMMHLNDDTGVYTDTAEFTEIIPECTNISVGYDHEHSQREELNLVYYQQLSSAVLLVDWESLPVKRDPTQPDPDDRWGRGSWRGYNTSSTVPTGTSLVDWYEDYDVAGYGHDSRPIDGSYHTYDPEFERIYDDLIDFKYGHVAPLLQRIADIAYPEDPALAVKHMNAKQLDPKVIDDLLYEIDDMTPVALDYALLELFDLMHVA